MAGNSVHIANRQVRLFRREDKVTQFWQAAFKLPWRERPLVKSTRCKNLRDAKAWAASTYHFLLEGEDSGPVADGDEEKLSGFISYNFKPRIRGGKREVEREVTLLLLRAVDAEPLISQRRLAEKLNISIGVCNMFLNECVKDGWIEKKRDLDLKSRGLAYFLTASGHSQKDALTAHHLKTGLTMFRQLRTEFGRILDRCQERGMNRVGFIGQGELADVAQLELNRRDMDLCGILATEDWSRYADRPGHLPGWLSECDALVITDHRQQNSLADIIRKHLAGVPVYAIEF